MLLLNAYLKAQINLVSNYSFEKYDTCPKGLSYLTPSCSDWFTPMSKMTNPPAQYSLFNWGSSDYFNNCSSNSQIWIPNNIAGTQFAKAGDSYVGFLLLRSFNFKEYIETELDTSLEKDKRYNVEFYYSIAEYGSVQDYHPLEIGALLTDTVVYRLSGVGTDQPQNINTIPQVKQQLPAIKDTLNWIKVSGDFIAKGGEKFLTIGNFQTTDTLQNKNVYVYIDDVKLWAAPVDTVEPILHPYLKVYPNPTLEDKKITFEHVHSDLNGYHLIIHNYLGQRVFEAVFDQPGSKITLHLPHFASGVYSFRLRNEKNINYGGKFVVLE
jgi:hypothetical protein